MLNDTEETIDIFVTLWSLVTFQLRGLDPPFRYTYGHLISRDECQVDNATCQSLSFLCCSLLLCCNFFPVYYKFGFTLNSIEEFL